MTVELTPHETDCILVALCVHEDRKIHLDALQSRSVAAPLFRRRIDNPVMNPQTCGGVRP